jgi:hypothetical protein
MNRKQILIGLTALFVGLMVYLVDRPPDQTYFVYKSGSSFSLYHVLPPLFGPIGKILPAFIHVFSLALLTAGILACNKRGCVLACIAWLSIDVSFELGQKFGVWASDLVPTWFEGIPVLENTVNFFTFGTFDFMDLTAIVVGSLAAYFTMMRTLERRV